MADNGGPKTILLVYPGKKTDGRERIIPLSVMSLATPLERAGFKPILYDQRVDGDFRRLFESLRDDLLFVGISTLTGNTIIYGLGIARFVREGGLTAPLIWGGVHPTLIPDQTLENPYVDIVVRGEGEETVVALAKALRDRVNLNQVEGISYKEEGRIHHTADRLPPDFDILPPVDYTLLDPSKYGVEEYLSYQSSRGCPFRCTFCDVRVFHGRRQKFKRAETVLNDLERMVDRFHPARIEFVDDNFLTDLKRAEGIIRGLIERQLKFEWLCTCRANFFPEMSDGFLDLMKKSGCSEIYVGIESGSQRMLDILHKDITTDQILNAAERLVRAGIKMSSNFVSGFPEESLEDFQQSMEMHRRLNQLCNDPKKLYIGGILLYAPYPGTEEFEKAVKGGYHPPRNFESWGRFMLNDRQNTPWHPKKHVDYILTVAQITRGGTYPVSLRSVARALIRGPRWLVLYYLLKHMAYYRWKYRFFKFPLDMRLLDWVGKRIFGYG
jgi:radical SAM superfamily enzyme YgiQ (UPF0313 family)